MNLTGDAAEDRLRAIRDRVGQIARERVRAEHARDAAQAQADRARTALSDEFGVHTVTDAKTLLDTLKTQLDHEIRELETNLDSIGT